MQKNKQILVVDNELFIREIFSHMLSTGGFDIQTACSNEVALTFLARCKYDLILLDVHMDGMTFSNFIKIIRDDSKLNEIPVIAVTGAPDLISAVDRSHIQGVLEKPFTPESLLESVQLFI